MTLASPTLSSPFRPLRFALRELRGGLHGFRIFVACIALGVMAIAGVGSFARSLTDGLSRSSKQMTEQVAAVFVKRPLDQEQLDALEEMLIEADLGPHAAARITAAFGEERFGKSSTAQLLVAPRALRKHTVAFVRVRTDILV